MTLLTMIQNVCDELSLDPPTEVISSTDPMVSQLLRLVKRQGDDMARDYDWTKLIVLREFTATADYPQNEPPDDLERFLDNSTLWNKSRLWRVNGPVLPSDWQRLRVINSNPVPQIWRMMDGKIDIYPITAGEVYSYEYVSGEWIEHIDGSTGRTFTADTDTARISERIIELGVIYRWKKAKGFAYADFEADYQKALENEVGSDRAQAPWTLSKPWRGQPPGSWWPGTVIGS